MHDILCIYQTYYCKITFRDLPCITYIALNCPVVGKTTLLHHILQQTAIIPELQLNLQKHINICCGFNEISVKRKNCVAR